MGDIISIKLQSKMLNVRQLFVRSLLRPVPTSFTSSKAKHTLPDLPYDYNALEPIISTEILQLHHSKHHQKAVDDLNTADEKMADAVSKGDTSSQIGLQATLKYNGGGHINHCIMWQTLCPISQSGEPSSDLGAAINKDFGSLENLQLKLSASAVGIQGVGSGWLGYSKEEKKLRVTTCANQDPLEAATGMVPLFGIDVWEHAYYLQYRNVRPDYAKAIWQLANWADISGRFANASA